MSIKDVSLVTGSSTGFGQAAAATLARHGYIVFATMREISGRDASIGGLGLTDTFEGAARIVHRELPPTLKNDLNSDNWFVHSKIMCLGC